MINYLAKRKDRLRYKRLLERNLPVGSDVVEAACKTLATKRMKRSGMSWLDEGGQAVLTRRSLIQSNRWEHGWVLLVDAYRQEVGPNVSRHDLHVLAAADLSDQLPHSQAYLTHQHRLTVLGAEDEVVLKVLNSMRGSTVLCHSTHRTVSLLKAPPKGGGFSPRVRH